MNYTAKERATFTRGAEQAETLQSEHLAKLPDVWLCEMLRMVHSLPASTVVGLLGPELLAGILGVALTREADRRWGLNSAQGGGSDG